MKGLHVTPRTVQCRHAFGVLFPLRASLRKELGEQLLSTGLVGAAMGVFEEEELWDSLIICYRLLQKLPQAQELVHARLQVWYCHFLSDVKLLHLLGSKPFNAVFAFSFWFQDWVSGMPVTGHTSSEHMQGKN